MHAQYTDEYADHGVSLRSGLMNNRNYWSGIAHVVVSKHLYHPIERELGWRPYAEVALVLETYWYVSEYFCLSLSRRFSAWHLPSTQRSIHSPPRR